MLRKSPPAVEHLVIGTHMHFANQQGTARVCAHHDWHEVLARWNSQGEGLIQGQFHIQDLYHTSHYHDFS